MATKFTIAIKAMNRSAMSQTSEREAIEPTKTITTTNTRKIGMDYLLLEMKGMFISP